MSDPTNDRPSCGENEPFALQVLGDSMEPEFEHGSIIVLDPGHPPFSGAYVVAQYEGEFIFRQFVQEGDKRYLKPVNPNYPTIELTKPCPIKGVVWQKTYKRQRKHYL